jgi:hypothetical protein
VFREVKLVDTVGSEQMRLVFVAAAAAILSLASMMEDWN